MNIVISNSTVSLIGLTIILSLLICTFPKVIREIFKGTDNM